MAIMAHPDDIEFACAGTMAKWAAEGRDLIYVVCTNGDKGSSDPEMTPERLAAIREAEQCAAAEAVGVREVVFLRYPDSELEDTKEFRREIVRLIRRHRPDIVVTMDPTRPYQLHRDHRTAGRVAMDAVFPYARDRMTYPELLDEGLEPHKVAELYLAGSDHSDTWIDISDTVDRKIAALRCHASQVGDGEWLEERVREAAAATGEPAGLALAEAFKRLELRR